MQSEVIGYAMEHNPVFAENYKKLNTQVSRGLCGQAHSVPDTFLIQLTNRCNLHCTMCHFRYKDYENLTYENQPPMDFKLDDYKAFLLRSLPTGVGDNGEIVPSDRKITFLFTEAESMMNPDVAEICRFTKQMYPNAHIRMISNGTVPPPKPEMVKDVDEILFSLDGCTAETFEKIRTPAKFTHVMKILERWDAVAAEHNPAISYVFTVVLQPDNMHELPGIVELAGRFTHVRQVHAGPITVTEELVELSAKYQDFDADAIKFEKIDAGQGLAALEKAEAAADRLGIQLYVPPSVKEAFGYKRQPKGLRAKVGALIDRKKLAAQKVPEALMQKPGAVEQLNCMCGGLTDGFMVYSLYHDCIFPCCNMPIPRRVQLAQRYGLQADASFESIYNSEGYWQMRRDLLDGKLLQSCAGCRRGCDYFSSLAKFPMED